MKVGDLVKCPETIGYDPKDTVFLKTRPGYVGVVTHVCGYKITVLGGNVVSWDGIEGKRMWDKADLTLVKR